MCVLGKICKILWILAFLGIILAVFGVVHRLRSLQAQLDDLTISTVISRVIARELADNDTGWHFK
jgi:hypothetical protein